MVITKIEQQKRHPDRINLYVDGEFTFGLHKESFIKFGLRKGDTIDGEMIDRLVSGEEFIIAKRKALRLLNSRMRSENELRTKLLENEFSPSVSEAVLDNLRLLGLVDDAKFARAFIRDARLLKPRGKRLLQRQLRVKGIPLAVVRSVLDENCSTADELKAALHSARRYLEGRHPTRKGLDDRKLQHRISRFLLRRGFEWSTISDVLRHTFKESELYTGEN